MYSRNPVKNAPAPSAITVRSRKIQSPNANRLSMLVWFRPLMRQSAAAYTPNANIANQGATHSANRVSEQRFRPLVMRELGMWGLLPGEIHARCVVVNLRLRPQRLQQPHAAGGPLELCQVAELNGLRGTCLGARRRVLRRARFLGGMPSAVAEVAHLHHAAHPRR